MYQGSAGYEEQDPRNILQMIGRAGRPGFDRCDSASIGICIRSLCYGRFDVIDPFQMRGCSDHDRAQHCSQVRAALQASSISYPYTKRAVCRF